MDKWKAGDRPLRVIDLADLRKKAGLTPPPSASEAPLRRAEREHKRQVRAMLFADVKNFSKLPEKWAPDFFLRFLRLVEEVLRTAAVPPLFSNTWGDGLYVVFEGVVGCADFALRLLEELEKVNWEELGLPRDTGVRIGLHTGPVFKGLDPIIRRE